MIETSDVVRIHKAINPIEGLAILESPEVREVTQPEASEETLVSLSNTPNEFLQALIAANTTTPTFALSYLSRSTNEVVLSEVVGNAHTSISDLVSIANSVSLQPRVAMMLANSPRLPWEALQILIDSDSQDAFVKFSAMTNPNVPEDVLSSWAKSPDPMKLRAAAANPSTPKTSLAEIYYDGAGHDGMVLDGIAQNPNTPRDVLVDIATKALVEHALKVGNHSQLSREMRAAILAFINPSFPYDIIPVPQGERFHSIRVNIARRKNLPENVLHQLTHDITMHGPILNHDILPQSVLSVLLQSPHGRVRYLAASHPSVAPVLARTLVHSEDPFVRAGAVLHQGYDGGGEFSVSGDWVAEAANDASATVREAVSCRNDLPMEAYISLINDPDGNVRKQALKTVEENDLWRFLSDSAVLSLACDPNPDVRIIAKEYFLSGDARKRSEMVVLPWAKEASSEAKSEFEDDGSDDDADPETSTDDGWAEAPKVEADGWVDPSESHTDGWGNPGSGTPDERLANLYPGLSVEVGR